MLVSFSINSDSESNYLKLTYIYTFGKPIYKEKVVAASERDMSKVRESEIYTNNKLRTWQSLLAASTFQQ